MTRYSLEISWMRPKDTSSTLKTKKINCHSQKLITTQFLKKFYRLHKQKSNNLKMKFLPLKTDLLNLSLCSAKIRSFKKTRIDYKKKEILFCKNYLSLKQKESKQDKRPTIQLTYLTPKIINFNR
jgi:hypothetical protein